GDLAYVGGGFGKGVHSVLEPMIYGLPVLTGPNIEVSHEARLANQQGILQIASDAAQVEKWMEAFLSDEHARHRIGEKARGFVDERLGASKRIADLLSKELELS
ncbi:3-deoxy-D-manno-octulosonic acid transferase, partial [bacterium]|nr:3-deoxy-D-manno-octulosonic acid transferase [bacterium]